MSELRKSQVLIQQAGEEGRPAVPAFAFRCYAAPPPLGYMYTPLPSVATFRDWVQLIVEPAHVSSAIDGYTFYTLADIIIAFGGDIPPYSVPVHDGSGLIGFNVPNTVITVGPAYWTGPTRTMQFFTFPDAPDHGDNGYPIGPGPYEGYVDLPQADGSALRVTRTFVKNSLGCWVPSHRFPDPPGCFTGGPMGVLVQAPFAGSPYFPGTPDWYLVDYRTGWNAGAVTTNAFDGNVHAAFSANVVGGACIGLAHSPRGDVRDYRNITHGFYFDSHPATGRPRVGPMELGRLVGAQREYSPDSTVFELNRTDGIVSYTLDGTVIGVSPAFLGGELVLAASFWRALDRVTDGVVWETLDPTPTPIPDAVGRGELDVFGSAWGGDPDTGHGGGVLGLREDNVGSDPILVPPSFGDGTLSMLAGYSYGPGVPPPATGAGTIDLIGYGFELPDFGMGTLDLFGLGIGGPVFPPTPPTTMDVSMQDAFDLTDENSSLVTAVMAARLRMGASYHRVHFQGMAHLRDTLGMDTTLHAVFHHILAVNAHFGGSLTPDYRAIVVIEDALVLAGVCHSHLEAHATIIDALVFGSLLANGDISTMTDALAFGAILDHTLDAITAMLDGLDVGASQTGMATLIGLMPDTLVLGGALHSDLDAHEHMADRIDFLLNLNLDGTDYVAYALNPETKGLTRFTHYPFNSFMQIGDQYYGAADDGLYLLGGPDDAGEPIAARIRFGMSSLGSRLLKRVPVMYLGYSTDTGMLVKAITRDPKTDELRSDVYRLTATGNHVREGYVEFGRGLKSVYWDCVIENIDGGSFNLDAIEWRPVLLEQKVRGKNVGKA